MNIKLGSKVKDKVTLLEGIAIGKVEYLTGCNQYLVQPQGLDRDGNRKDSVWFDEQRLDVVGSEVMSFDNSKTPGADRPAPLK